MSKTFLFQAIQFSISILLVLFNPCIEPYQVLPLRARVDLGAKAIKGYSASDCLVSYRRTLVAGFLPLCREAVSVFYSPSRLGKTVFGDIRSSFYSRILAIISTSAGFSRYCLQPQNAELENMFFFMMTFITESMDIYYVSVQLSSQNCLNLDVKVGFMVSTSFSKPRCLEGPPS